MDTQERQMPDHHRAVMNRFVAACQADGRVVAAFLGGSYARDAADAYSDLDLGLITTDEAYEEVCAARAAFIRQLGEPVFLEDFGIPDIIFFIFPDDTEGELRFGRASHFKHMYPGPCQVLLDKNGILAGAVFPQDKASPAEQNERLRRLVYWFWHDFSHFLTAMARRQHWWAHGQLDVLRLMCVNLARLRHNFSDPYVGDDYFKVEQALPIEQLSSLEATFCPLEEDAMLQAGLAILRFYQELAPTLAQTHGLTYPAGLERVMVDRLDKLRAARSR